MSEWKLHVPDDNNRITRYKCGLVAGQRVRLKKDLVCTTLKGIATGKVYRAGEERVILTGITSDPALCFGRPMESATPGTMIPHQSTSGSRGSENDEIQASRPQAAVRFWLCSESNALGAPCLSSDVGNSAPYGHEGGTFFSC